MEFGTAAQMNGQSLRDSLNRVGLPWMTVLLIALMSSLIYLGPSLWQTWTHDGPTLVNAGGFVTGHDFVAFYAAAQAALGGDAAKVYNQEFLMSVQAAVVGSPDIGYLAFLYPPTYLLLITPLATLPYFLALAMWQALPLTALLLLLRRITLPPMALIMAAGAPAVAQALFAGQNGLLFAALFGGGFLVMERRPMLAGLLLGLATVKPQLAILLLPALAAGREWRVLAAMIATVVGLAALSAALLGIDTWSSYMRVPEAAHEFLALGQLPWSRMPTVYTAVRLAGGSDAAGMVLQIVAAFLTIAGVAWLWLRDAPRPLRLAGILAGAPLVTPFMYDYDLAFMLFAIALYLADSIKRGTAQWEKVMLLSVWLQPAWWLWQLVEATGISLSPLIYAGFLLAIIFRTQRARSRVAPARPGADA